MPGPPPTRRGTTFWRSAIRVGAFVRKELVGVVRQPLLVLTLVLGPFLILFLFGAGLRAEAPPVRTVFVAPAGSEVSEQARQYAETERFRLVVEGVTADLDASLRRLEGGELNLVVQFPGDTDAALRAGQQPSIVFFHDYLDPIEADAMTASMRLAVDEINSQVAQSLVGRAQGDVQDIEERAAAAAARLAAVRRAAADGDDDEVQQQLSLLQGEVAGLGSELADGAPENELDPGQEERTDETASGVVGDLAEQVDEIAERAPGDSGDSLDQLAAQLEGLQVGLSEFGRLPPNLFVSPFRGVAERVVEGPVGLTDYYAPAVLVLLAQHLAITFIGLSVVRDEQLGTTELFRVAPLTAGQVLLGTCIAHLLFAGVVTALLTGLLVVGLDVPMRGSWAVLALCVAAVVVASTGLGYLLALLADSATKAVQYAMMLLLASVFFSGFLVSLDRFQPLVQTVPWLLPGTYGVRMLRDVMLRGEVPGIGLLLALAAMAAAFLAASVWLLRRRLLRV